MNIYQICGLALCAAVGCMLPSVKHSEYSMAIRICFGVMVFSTCFLFLSPYFKLIENFSKGTLMESYFPLLTKCLGIAFLSEITASVCRDAGEESIAKNVELIGKTEIIILSFPLLQKLFEITDTLLGNI